MTSKEDKVALVPVEPAKSQSCIEKRDAPISEVPRASAKSMVQSKSRNNKIEIGVINDFSILNVRSPKSKHVDRPKDNSRRGLTSFDDRDATQDPILSVSVVKLRTVVREMPNLSYCHRFIGLTFSSLLLVAALCYMAGTVICLRDQKGKGAYFEQDATEVSFDEAVEIKKTNKDWVMETDDWGYFERAFSDVLDDSDSFWKKYDVFIAMAITGGVTGIMWVVTSIFEITKFLQVKWEYSIFGLVMCILSFLCFVGGNIYIYNRIILFYSDFKDFWQDCGCDSFRADYYRSTLAYIVGTGAVLVVSILELGANIAFCCKRPHVRAAPPQIIMLGGR